MPIIRTSHDEENPYVMLHKDTLEIETLSWESKGLWGYLLSRKDNWQVSVEHLRKTFPAGRDKIKKMLKELNEHGLCERNDLRKNGKVAGIEYVIFEKPRNVSPFTEKPLKKSPPPRKPLTGKPFTEKPLTEKHTQVKYKEEEKKENKIHTSEQAVEIADALYNSIISWKGKLSNVNLSKWAREIDRVIRIDGVDPCEIMDVIVWLSTNEFWRKNVLSGAKLRKQFDRLDAEMKSQQKPNGSQSQDAANLLRSMQ